MRCIPNDHLNEFTDTGLVLMVNQFLHIFGFALAYTVDPATGVTSNLTVNRTRFRGFDGSTTANAYKKLSRYMAEHADELLEEAREP